MAPALLPRSFSTPSATSQPATSRPHSRRSQDEAWKTKSLPTTPNFDVPTFNAEFQLDTAFFSASGQPPDSKSNASEVLFDYIERQDDQRKPTLARSKTTHFIDKPRTWFASADPAEPTKVKKEAQDSFDPGHGERRQSQPGPESTGQLRKAKGAPAPARRSWIPSVRSLSRPATPTSAIDLVQVDAASDRSSSEQTRVNEEKSRLSSKRFKKPGLSLTTRFRTKPDLSVGHADSGQDSDQSRASSSLSLVHAGSSSTDTYASRSTSGLSTADTADDSGSDMDVPHKDPLSTSISALTEELQHFKAKQTSQRVHAVQTVLVPFLNSTAHHASTLKLCLNDVERRASMLNGWWRMMLDMLEESEAPQKHPLAHVDRPCVLEAIAMIMIRPEWRQTTSYYQPLKDRSPNERIRSRTETAFSSTSQSTTHSESQSRRGAQSARDTFRANLMRQMRFVVEKMTLRHSPTSLVIFSAKTCAYAFFFAPGVADILLRLWGLSHEAIRRTAGALGLPMRNTKESEDIAALFPPHLNSYGWTSPRAMWHQLTQSVQMHPHLSDIPWSGPWVARWKGRDTDLFYIFCKYFHILAEQFIPSGLPLVEKARSPAFAIIQAQLLSLVDSTIHSQAHAGGSPLVDHPRGPEASLMAVPIPSANMAKGMSEHRLVVLLKDLQSDLSEEEGQTKVTFVEACSVLLQAAASRTLQHNHAACFNLCDLLEEIVNALYNYSAADKTSVKLDWNFWLNVCAKMLETHHTMTEVRVLSFVYSVWDAMTQSPLRKLKWCDWLTSVPVFDKFFNHWCPMVRAYYQRLLCWRICRDDGAGNSTDDKIFMAVAERLRTAWAHYLYLKQEAESNAKPPPSTAPMVPTPGKKFIIIRQEAELRQQSLFMGSDSFARPSGRETFEDLGIDLGNAAKEGGRKRWNLLGKALSFSAGTHTTNEPLSSHLGTGKTGSSSSLELDSPLVPVKSSVSSSPKVSPRLSSTLSSAATQDGAFVFTFYLSWQQHNMSAQNRILTPPRLPAPAHARTIAGAHTASHLKVSVSLPGSTQIISGGPPVSLVGEARSVNSPRIPGSTQRTNASLSPPLRPSMSTPKSYRSDASDTTVGPTALKDVQEQLAKLSAAFEPQIDQVVEAKKPSRFYAGNVVYSGRALAEWGTVVFECNSFVERRRDEGALGLGEIEVPLLGVEGFRRFNG